MKSTKVALPALLSACVMLAACQSATTGSAAIESAGGAPFCAVAEPIFYSQRDTPETQRQAREHNAVGVALACPSFLAPARHGEGTR